MTIPALTLRQPWAWAVAHCGKNIENRSWNRHYRGPIAIHAGISAGSNWPADLRVREFPQPAEARP